MDDELFGSCTSGASGRGTSGTSGSTGGGGTTLVDVVNLIDEHTIIEPVTIVLIDL